MTRTDAWLIAAIVALASFSSPAEAHGRYRGHIGIGIGIGVPWVYGYPAPYVVAPAPVYLAPPPVTGTPVPPVAPEPIFYPRQAQTPEQTEIDRRECNRWAMTQRDAMADAGVFHRATLACMDGRGYTSR